MKVIFGEAQSAWRIARRTTREEQLAAGWSISRLVELWNRRNGETGDANRERSGDAAGEPSAVLTTCQGEIEEGPSSLGEAPCPAG